VPFVVVNPRRGSRALAELQRCLLLGAAGVGELMPDGQGYALHDAGVVAPLAHLATELSLPLLTHASEPLGHDYPGKGTVTPRTIYRFVEQFPEVTLVCGHWGGGLPFFELMPEVRQKLANVYYDTAAGLFLYRDDIFAAVVAMVGARKILFASDYPLIGQARYLKRLHGAGLDEAALANVLGGNAQRLLHRGGQV
jgi:predicted TIM-barrel fold metal-dependent hydrolase